MRLDPETKRRLKIFRSNRRAFFSLWVLTIAFALSLFSELIANNRPYVLRYEGKTYFPLFKFYSAKEFGAAEDSNIEYKRLEQEPAFQKPGNWMLFPPVRFASDESDSMLPMPPPARPSKLHVLGTDDRGRDLLTRLIYGFRNSMLFALFACGLTIVVAYLVGAVQGFLGGKLDFVGQRGIEIWSALPMLYVILFLLSILPSSLSLLAVAWVAFSWMGLSGYIRAEVLRLRKMDFVVAAQALGAGTPRILFRHILPNALVPIITFFPFLIAAAIGGLAALDYLGLGLPAPTASWGELLRQGKENLISWWLSVFPFLCLFVTLLLLTFTGEGVREAFDTRD